MNTNHNPLTRRQRDVLAVIVAYRQVHGVMPTLRGIGDALGVTVGCVKAHIFALARKGVLTWDAGRHRSLRLTEAK